MIASFRKWGGLNARRNFTTVSIDVIEVSNDVSTFDLKLFFDHPCIEYRRLIQLQP